VKAIDTCLLELDVQAYTRALGRNDTAAAIDAANQIACAPTTIGATTCSAS